jgi:prepilin-type N-terminal cleavage/methylation domain-containing protein
LERLKERLKTTSGLSLIELLVVLAILGLATATVSLTLRQGQDPLAQLKPLLAQVQAAQQWAMWKRQTVVVASTTQEIVFSSPIDMQAEDWAKPFPLPKGLHTEPQQIIFVASGLNPPQRLLFHSNNGDRGGHDDKSSFVLTTDARNHISLNRVQP